MVTVHERLTVLGHQVEEAVVSLQSQALPKKDLEKGSMTLNVYKREILF